MRTRKRLALIMTLVVAVTACGGGGGDGDSADPGGGASPDDLPECPLDALDEATEPVEITFWHTMTRANEEALVALTDAFNGSQDDVVVSLVNNNSADDQHEKYLAALETGGQLPDLVQSQEFYLQQMVDTQSVLPVASCIEAADQFDTDDFVERTLAYYEIQDVQWALPFAVSEPILLFDRTAFEGAGLDPDAPPATFDDLRAAAQALVDAGHEYGLGLKLDAWHLEQMLAWQGESFVNNGNGRDDRATEVAFDTDTAVETFAFLKGLVDDGLAVTNSADGGSSFDNLLSVGTGKVGMTIDASGSLGTIIDVLEGGQYPDVAPAVAPVPGLEDDGGVLVGGSGLYISASGDEPAKQAAAWRFAEFLTSPESQSQWAAATGFIPVRQSAAEQPEIQQRWEEIPGFRVAFDEINEGAENEATAGPAIGDYRGVRRIVAEAESRMFLEDLSPEDAIAQAVDEANAALQSYNDRL